MPRTGNDLTSAMPPRTTQSKLMRLPRGIVPLALALLGQVTLSAAQQPAVPCASLATQPLPHLTITMAVEVTTGRLDDYDSLPPFCRVAGVLRPVPTSEIAFEIWLPLDRWNGKLAAVGHGGWAGYINYAQPVGGGMRGQLRRGYAATSTNTGHVARPGTEMARFARDNPEALIDFAWRAQHEGAVAAKAVVEQFYGRKPSYSYFLGASSGGRHALISAQRFPDDYDGIVAAAPAHDFTATFAGLMDLYLTGASDTAARIGPPLLRKLARAVVAACDADDGVTDSIISAPWQCQFDPESLACPTGGGGDVCLNAAQRALLRRAYAGYRDPRSGLMLLPGFEPGFELGLFGHTLPTGPLPLLTSYYRWVVTTDTTWTWRSVPSENPARASALLAERSRLAALLDATDPDLEAFRARGGKLILYHGWNDEVIPPKTTLNYFERVLAELGGGEPAWKLADGFVRLFLPPAVSHNGWNPELQSALEAWVERGEAPEILSYMVERPDGPTVPGKVCRYRPDHANRCGG